MHNMEAKNGLAHLLELSCLECDCTKSLWTSKKIDKIIGCKARGKSGFDVNTCSVISMREIGKGYTALKTFFYFFIYAFLSEDDDNPHRAN